MSITGAMLISLKVVRIALVDCDCSRRSAIRGHAGGSSERAARGDHSGHSARLPAGALPLEATEVVGAPVGIATAAATGFVAAPDATAPSTSPLVTRPSLPEPATDPAARLLSAISLAAAGMATPAIDAPDAGAAAAGAALGASGCRWRRGRRCCTGLAFGVNAGNQLFGRNRWFRPPSRFQPKHRRTAQALQAPPCRSPPQSGFHPRRRRRPLSFFHCSNVASATDSDSCGTLTSTIAISILSVLRFYAV